MSTKKDTINWLFNQIDARKAVSLLGARNLSVIRCVVRHGFKQDKTVSQYTKMVQYGSQQADQELVLWMKSEVEKHKKSDDSQFYLYFQFIRYE